MVAEIFWLDEAKDDLRAILEYIAAENPLAANSYVSGLSQACEKLANFPLSGRRYNSEFRCFVFRNHLVFYRFDEAANHVRIASVIDGRRDLARMIGEAD